MSKVVLITSISDTSMSGYEIHAIYAVPDDIVMEEIQSFAEFYSQSAVLMTLHEVKSAAELMARIEALNDSYEDVDGLNYQGEGWNPK